MITDREQIKRTLSEKELFVFDMDGTIYLGENVFRPAVDFIKKLRENGKKVLFFTNNASRTPEFYIIRLSRMGFEPSRDEIMTSGDVTAEYLSRECSDKKVYVMGTPELVRSFRKHGINVICGDDGEIVPGTHADIVVTSFDTTLTYNKLKYSCEFVSLGARYISTHPDLNCPTEDGRIPDSGSIAAAVTASTGVVPEYFGKPEKSCVDTIAARLGVDKSRIVMIGDRLYTDIAAGRNSGVTSLLVLTGETDAAMLESATEGQIPDIALRDLCEASEIMFG